jgi:hypothetical protein
MDSNEERSHQLPTSKIPIPNLGVGSWKLKIEILVGSDNPGVKFKQS